MPPVRLELMIPVFEPEKMLRSNLGTRWMKVMSFMQRPL
jgi:hypothetical protein